jgi:alpha-ketoglutarate-dependent taurine dioxygenase
MKHEGTSPYATAASPQFLTATFEGRPAWRRESVSPEDWLIPLPAACTAEFDAVVEILRQQPQPVEQLAPAAFSLPACAAVMAQVRHKLQDDIGFAVVDRVPVERYSPLESMALGWLLAGLFGQVVSQKWDGTRLYGVQDYGKPLGYGVRRSVTNLEQEFHTDGGWLAKTPESIGLFCLQPAREGGLNRVASLLTVHNDLQRQHPDLLARLYQPFWWDRQAEHDPHDVKCSAHPVYELHDHTLSGRYYDDYVMNGYKLAGEPLDHSGVAALRAMRMIINAPENWVEFHTEKGQLLYVNNRQFAHSRTAFVDTSEPHLRRHLLRLWNRNAGPPDLEAQGRSMSG